MIKLSLKNVRLPTILIQFQGPILIPGAQDIFLYLRPETNGLLVESMLFRVLKLYSAKCQVVYLANVPGDFIVKNKIIEQHYAVKINFAKRGKKAFTPAMRQEFEKYFGISFKSAKIIGAFKALEILSLSEEELFRLWVPPENYTQIHGQSIKQNGDYFIVNYDIPAILHKNSRKMDIAVMIFRSFLGIKEFHHMVKDMRKKLIDEKVITPDRPLARTFHYSHGPFEQILDGIGYLYTENGKHLPLESISFFAFLIKNNCTNQEVLKAVKNPLMKFKINSRKIIEENIFSYTTDDTYADALEKFKQRIVE